MVRTRGPGLTPRGVRRPRRVSLAASAVAAALVVVLPGTVARADPSVSEIEAQIAQIWAQAEPLIEQYNSIHQQYEQNQAKQAELAAALQPLQQQVEQAQVKVGAMAAQAYRGSQTLGIAAVLSGGSPQDMADRLSFLDSLARAQERELHDVTGLKKQYDEQKAPIDQLVVELAAQDKDLQEKKAVIESQLDQLQQLRRQAYGTTNATGSFRPWPCPEVYAPTPGYTAAAWACSQAGKPYVWAAAGPNSYDCSGLTMAAWAQVGVYLPHNSAAQRRSMPYVDRADLQVGDLVFFYSDLHHVAIYEGDNKVMQAPQAGDYVRMTDLSQMGPIHSYGRPG